MNTAYLLLGSNEGNREQWITRAKDLIISLCGPITKTSAIYKTAAWGLHNQPDFYNVAISVNTPLTPTKLLIATQQIEKQLGRQRVLKWGQRTLDIDILFYNKDIIDTTELRVPHPHLQERRFALVPLHEIAPELQHPVFHQSISALLAACPDTLAVEIVR